MFVKIYHTCYFSLRTRKCIFKSYKTLNTFQIPKYINSKIKFRLFLSYTNLQQYFQELSQKIYHWLAEKIVYCDCEKFNVVKCIEANTIVLKCLYTLEYSVEYLELKNN
jgi:hypothetical protein